MPLIKNAMKRLNSQSGSIEMVHCSVYPQYGPDDCDLFALGYIIALSENKDPSKLIFEQISMRASFNLNLELGGVSQFNCNELTNTFVVYTNHLLDLSGRMISV